MVDAPVLLAGLHAQHLATRSEAHLGADWMVVPAARSLHWRCEVLRKAFFVCKEKVAPGEELSVNLEKLVERGNIFPAAAARGHNDTQ